MNPERPKVGRLLRPDQAAEILNASRPGVYRLLAEGQLVGLKIRGSIRIVESSIQDYLHRQIAIYRLEIGVGEANTESDSS